MTIGIMQPYFLPYIGYFQLINAVDRFVVYDNIEFTKKGWINRNRFLLNGTDTMFTIPLKKDSDFLNVNERFLADNSHEQIDKIKRQIISAYKKTKQFEMVYPIVEKCFDFTETKNLFEFIFNSIKVVCNYLEISTELVAASVLGIGRELKGEEKVIAICKQQSADTYINAIGGTDLYSSDVFLRENISLKFIKTQTFSYSQSLNEFVPYLSILDVVMHNDKKTVQEYLTRYDLIDNNNKEQIIEHV